MSYNCDYDEPGFYREVLRRSKKSHKCCECRLPINLGQRYFDIALECEKSVVTHKQHVYCWNFSRIYNSRIENEHACIPFGYIKEALMENYYGDSPKWVAMWNEMIFKYNPDGKIKELICESSKCPLF